MKSFILVIALLMPMFSYAYNTKKECHDDCVRKYYEEKRTIGMEWADVETDFARMTPILNRYCACIDWCKSLSIPEE